MRGLSPALSGRPVLPTIGLIGFTRIGGKVNLALCTLDTFYLRTYIDTGLVRRLVQTYLATPRKTMQTPLELVNLDALMAVTAGIPEVVIGVIDGPVDSSHPDLQAARLQTFSQGTGKACKALDSPACRHGTFVAGMLCARRGSRAPALCPGCTVVLRPIFCEVTAFREACPEVTPRHLASAIRETVDAGARVINLSVGVSSTSGIDRRELDESFDHAFRNGTVLVSASGNQGLIGSHPLFAHPWVIPVAACDIRGRLDAGSNLGPSVGRRGLMAPGVGVLSTAAGGGYTSMSGTSVAAPFVTATVALLWSLFPAASGWDLRRAIVPPGWSRRSITPPLLDARASWHLMREATGGRFLRGGRYGRTRICAASSGGRSLGVR